MSQKRFYVHGVHPAFGLGSTLTLHSLGFPHHEAAHLDPSLVSRGTFLEHASHYSCFRKGPWDFAFKKLKMVFMLLNTRKLFPYTGNINCGGHNQVSLLDRTLQGLCAGKHVLERWRMLLIWGPEEDTSVCISTSGCVVGL